MSAEKSYRVAWVAAVDKILVPGIGEQDLSEPGSIPDAAPAKQPVAPPDQGV